MFFVVVVIAFGVVALGVWANGRARRRLEALNEGPDDLKRAGDTDQPPSSSGYRGPVD